MKIYIKAKPNAKTERVKKIDESHFSISVKEPPVKGRANFAIIRMLAKYFGIGGNKVKIISGFTSVKKIVKVDIG